MTPAQTFFRKGTEYLRKMSGISFLKKASSGSFPAVTERMNEYN
jgi:hypothetical protein